MTLETRRPTGLPSWPMILLAGREGSGKSFGAAQASASQLIERTFWIGIGEDDPDEYGAIPGADFEIVVHDGTVRDIIRALTDVATLAKSEKPYLLVVDSMTKLWDLIVDNVQRLANQRAKGRKSASGDYTISPDLWNVAKKDWDDTMDAIRLHRGPSILTARLDEVMVMNDDGQPTKDKRWKVQAHKSLVYDAGMVVEMHERGQYLVTKTKSLHYQLDKPTEAPGFTIPGAWERLGITAEAGTGDRTFQRPVGDDPADIEAADRAAVEMWTARMKEKTTEEGIVQVWQEAVALQKQGTIPAAVLDSLQLVAADFRNKQAQAKAGEPEPLVSAGKPGPRRQWVREARALTDPEALTALIQEAKAHGTPEGVLDELGQLLVSLDAEPTPEPVTTWPTAEPGGDGWVETADGGFAEADVPEDGAA